MSGTGNRNSKLISACAAAAGAFLLSAAYVSAQTNLLLDGDFEPGESGSPNAAAGDVPMSTSGPWTGWNNWTSPWSAYYSQAIPALSGAQVGKTYSAPNAGIYQSTNTIVPGDAYTAIGYFYNYSSDALRGVETESINLSFYNFPGGQGQIFGVGSPGKVTANSPQNTWIQETVMAEAPQNAQSLEWMAFFNDQNPYQTPPLDPGGAMYVDNAELIDTSWNGGGASNNWSDPNNWGGYSPVTYAGQVVGGTGQYGTPPIVFNGTKSLVSNNDSPAGTNYYGITFNTGAGSFTVNGNAITTNADINNYSPNSQTINLGIGLLASINLNSQGGNLVINGAITGAGQSITADGTGTVILGGQNTFNGGTNVTGGTLVIGAKGALPNAPVSIDASTMQLGSNTGGATIPSLSITDSGPLDITNNHLLITYTPGNDPISTIQALILSGYNSGKWNGSGITSSAAATEDAVSGNPQYGIGYADSADPGNPAQLPSGTVEIKYTLLGDANLDGAVNGTDFAILATNFNKAVTSWDQGDFNYDGSVNGTDFADLATNFNKGASQADVAALDAFAEAHGLSLTSVPEPASAALLLLGASSLLSRRSRRGS